MKQEPAGLSVLPPAVQRYATTPWSSAARCSGSPAVSWLLITEPGEEMEVTGGYDQITCCV